MLMFQFFIFLRLFCRINWIQWPNKIERTNRTNERTNEKINKRTRESRDKKTNYFDIIKFKQTMGHNQKIDSTLDMNFCSIERKNQFQRLPIYLSKSSIYLNSTTFMEHLNVYFIVPKFGLFLCSSRHKLVYTIVNSKCSYEVETTHFLNEKTENLMAMSVKMW